jgi:hypothetical protein
MQYPDRRVVIFSFLLTLLLGAGVGLAAPPPSYVVTFPLFPHDECAYAGDFGDSFFGGSPQNWSSLTVKIPLLRFYYDDNPAPAVTIFLNGEQIGQPVVVTNSGSPSLCDGYANYEFTTTTLSSYRPQASNRLTVFSPDALMGALDAELTFTVLKDDYTVTGQILDGSAVESKKIILGTTTYAQVPLGLELQLGIKNNGAYVPAKYSLSPAGLIGLMLPTLYPTSAVLEYSRDIHEGLKTFRGVHIGTQILTIIPDDPQLSPFTFTLGVFDPGTLGDDNTFDPLIVTWGNRRGIPPHILKGLIRKEGPFNANEYRYEPLNGDTGDIGVTTYANVLEDEPYEHYRMATSANLSKGDLQLDLNTGSTYAFSDDISPRKIYHLPRGMGAALIPLRPIDVCPAACVSAKELVLKNDSSQNWTDYATFDISDPTDLAKIDFTAQTPLAASYGLMQEMYMVATELRWITTDGRRNPSLLFDSVANTAIGGGSVAVGTHEFYKRYRACRLGDFATDPDFADAAAYKAMMIDALNYYNHGDRNTNVTYGSDSWDLAESFRPAHPGSLIFP